MHANDRAVVQLQAPQLEQVAESSGFQSAQRITAENQIRQDVQPGERGRRYRRQVVPGQIQVQQVRQSVERVVSDVPDDVVRQIQRDQRGQRRQRVSVQLLDEIVGQVDVLQTRGQCQILGRYLEQKVTVQDQRAYFVQILQQSLRQAGDGIVAQIQHLQLAGGFERLLVHVGDVVAGQVQLLQRVEALQRVLGQRFHGVAAHVQRDQVLLEDEVVRAERVNRVRREIEGLQVTVEAERQVNVADAVVGQVQVSDLRVQLDRDDLEARVSARRVQALVVAAALRRAKTVRHH